MEGVAESCSIRPPKMGLLSTVQAGLASGPRVTPREVCAAVVSRILVGSRAVPNGDWNNDRGLGPARAGLVESRGSSGSRWQAVAGYGSIVVLLYAPLCKTRISSRYNKYCMLFRFLKIGKCK
jgi:hypothetical protein